MSLSSTLNLIAVNILLLLTSISSLSRTKFTRLSESSSQPSSNPTLRLVAHENVEIPITKNKTILIRVKFIIIFKVYKIFFKLQALLDHGTKLVINQPDIPVA
jgi:hypothetical protein